MATNNIVKTRIKNRIDTIENWQSSNVQLLPGEIALATLTVSQTDANGNIISVPAILAKVGGSTYTAAEIASMSAEERAVLDAQGITEGGLKLFRHLPWVSARAADVYDWAKLSNPEIIPVKATINAADTTKELKEHFDDIYAAIRDLEDYDDSVGEALTGGVHFIGVVAAEDIPTPTTVTPAPKVTLKTTPETEHTLEKGDIAIKEATTIEYIWTGSEWYELGDNSLLGRVHQAILDMDWTDPNSSGNITYNTSKGIDVITKVAQEDGQVTTEKHTVPYATTTLAGIALLGTSTGAATYERTEEIGDAVDDIAARGIFTRNKNSLNYAYIGTDQGDTNGEYAIIFDCGGATADTNLPNQ